MRLRTAAIVAQGMSGFAALIFVRQVANCLPRILTSSCRPHPISVPASYISRMIARSRIAASWRGTMFVTVALLFGTCLVAGARAEEQRRALDQPLVLSDADGKTV